VDREEVSGRSAAPPLFDRIENILGVPQHYRATTRRPSRLLSPAVALAAMVAPPQPSSGARPITAKKRLNQWSAMMLDRMGEHPPRVHRAMYDELEDEPRSS
jgi:hypothetical protein